MKIIETLEKIRHDKKFNGKQMAAWLGIPYQNYRNITHRGIVEKDQDRIYTKLADEGYSITRIYK